MRNIKTASNCMLCVVAQVAADVAASSDCQDAGDKKGGSDEAKDKNASWGRLRTAIRAAPETPAAKAAQQEYESLTGKDGGGVGKRIRLNKLRESWLEGLEAKRVAGTIHFILTFVCDLMLVPLLGS